MGIAETIVGAGRASRNARADIALLAESRDGFDVSGQSGANRSAPTTGGWLGSRIIREPVPGSFKAILEEST